MNDFPHAFLMKFLCTKKIRWNLDARIHTRFEGNDFLAALA